MLNIKATPSSLFVT